MGSSATQFQDPFNFSYASGEQMANNQNTASYLSQFGTGETGIPGFAASLFGIDTGRARDLRNKQMDLEYDRQSIHSARAWDEYMDSTKYQRAVADLKAAGLNPWLAVQNGMPGTGSPSVDTGGSASHQTKSDQSMTGLAGLLMAIAKMLA